MTEQTYITLVNGQQIPQMGLGVYQIPGDAATKEAVLAAFKLGYRHIDTAHAYQNERGVGQALQASGLDRSEVWITSKLWVSDYGPEITPVAIDKMLERLGTDYLDLLLLHQQVGDYNAAWQAMEAAYQAGKLKSIGISNFDGERLDDLLAQATIKPQVMQVEMHPYYQQRELKAKMAPFGTQFESWYPLGHGDPKLINEPIFTQLATKYHKSNIQIILRWHLQSGNIVFPKSTSPAHLQANFDIFDFQLTADEMAQIDALESRQRYYTTPYEDQVAMFSQFVPAD